MLSHKAVARIRRLGIVVLYGLCLGAGVASLLWVGDHIKIYIEPVRFIVE